MAGRGRCPSTGKTRLRWFEARKAAKRARRREGVPVQEYRCSACGWWHFGHPPPDWPRHRRLA